MFSNARETLGKVRRATVFGFVAYVLPMRMIAVLFPARASRPVACRCPFASVEIHTLVQAGGIAKALIRANSDALRTAFPAGVR